METLEIPKGSKTEIYEALLPQIQALIEGESNLYAKLNTARPQQPECSTLATFLLIKRPNPK